MSRSYAVLKSLGLHVNDISVYDALISIGRSKTGAILKMTGIASSRVYESLQTLTRRGLVAYDVRNNVRYYRAVPPIQLQEEVLHYRDALAELSSSIVRAQASQRANERNIVNVYEGKRGFKQAFEQFISSLGKGDTNSFMGFTHRSSNMKELRYFMKQLDVKSLGKKLRTRALYDERLISTMVKERIAIPGYEIRHLPPEHFSPAGINISKQEVLISIWTDEPVAISIRSAIIARNFLSNFEFLWERASKLSKATFYRKSRSAKGPAGARGGKR